MFTFTILDLFWKFCPKIDLAFSYCLINLPVFQALRVEASGFSCLMLIYFSINCQKCLRRISKSSYHHLETVRSSHPEVFPGTNVLKITANLQENIHAKVRFGCSPVNLLHIFRATFLKNTSGWLLLNGIFGAIYSRCFMNNLKTYFLLRTLLPTSFLIQFSFILKLLRCLPHHVTFNREEKQGTSSLVIFYNYGYSWSL